MDKKEAFKNFVKDNPVLVKYIKDGSMSWQKFYEIYDIYGNDSNAWKDYLGVATAATVAASSTDILGFIKNLDLDSIQSGVSSVQRVVGVFQDLVGNKGSTTKSEYKPRPTYKHLDD